MVAVATLDNVASMIIDFSEIHTEKEFIAKFVNCLICNNKYRHEDISQGRLFAACNACRYYIGRKPHCIWGVFASDIRLTVIASSKGVYLYSMQEIIKTLSNDSKGDIGFLLNSIEKYKILL